MSTEAPTRGDRNRRRRRRRFALGFVAVLAALVVVGGAGAAVALAQGPRITGVEVDPSAAIEASGSRVILTASERMAPVDPGQVEVTPAAAFTVDTSGRSIGIRFASPLDDATDYTVRIHDAAGAGGGPVSTLSTTFRTADATIYLLRRGGEGGDTIFRTGIDGEAAVPVFQAPAIEDFRATPSHLTVVLREEDDFSRVVVTDPDGANVRDLLLPGEGYVTSLQSADRGERVGFVFTDSLTTADGQESALYTASLRPADVATPPARVVASGYDGRIADWRFVPDTDSILLLTFDNALVLTANGGADITVLGTAATIEGVARGSLEAVVGQVAGQATVDLRTGEEAPLVAARGVEGTQTAVLPLPGDAAGTVRAYGLIGDGGVALGTTVARVDEDGAATPILQTPGSSAVLQLCASPNGRYTAVLVAPNIVANPYDTYALPIPTTVETHIVDTRTGAAVSVLGGFDISWCRVPPA